MKKNKIMKFKIARFLLIFSLCTITMKSNTLSKTVGNIDYNNNLNKNLILMSNGDFAWEKNRDYYGIRLTSIIPTVICSSILTHATSSTLGSIATVAIVGAEFAAISYLSNRYSFTNRDMLGMLLCSGSTFLTTMFLINDFGKQKDESIRYKIAAIASYLSYWGSKPLMDLFNINLASIFLATQLNYTLGLNAHYLEVSSNITTETYHKLGGLGSMALFFAGTALGKFNNLSMDCYGILSNYSDSLALLAHNIPCDPKGRSAISFASALLPFLFSSYFEKKIELMNSEYIYNIAKLSELCGLTLGILALYTLNISLEQSFKIAIPIGISLSTLASTLYLLHS